MLASTHSWHGLPMVRCFRKKECLSLSQFNCQTTSFDVQSKFQIFPSHSIFLVRNFPPFRVLLLVLCVCVCECIFFGPQIIMKEKRTLQKKRKNNNCACFKSIYESVFITCSYYEILAANLSLLHYILCVCFFFFISVCIENAYLRFNNQQ